MEILKNIQVKSSHHKKPILTDVFFERNSIKKSIVIFCHGYKGYKDWGAWNLVAEKFADKNLFFIKFNFSHNGGTAKNPIDFPDLEAFGENNYSIELHDLEDIINWICTNLEFKEEIDPENITLIGHSRGGGIVLLKSSENTKISKVITWCGVSDFGTRFLKGEQLEAWRTNGIYYVENGRTKQKMPHLFQFYTNFKKNEKRLTIKSAVSNLTIPQLIIQGEIDEVVTLNEAENLNKWNPESQLIIIPQMNHTLGSAQPWELDKMPVYLEDVVNKSINFIVCND